MADPATVAAFALPVARLGEPIHGSAYLLSMTGLWQLLPDKGTVGKAALGRAEV